MSVPLPALLLLLLTQVPGQETDQVQREDALFDESPFEDIALHIQKSLDEEKLNKAKKIANLANGVLLATTGPVALLMAAFQLKLPKVITSFYLTVMGSAITAIELQAKPIAPWIKEHLRFIDTQRGRTALIAVAGGLAWSFGKPALLAALLTTGNALFNAYFDKLLLFVTADERAASRSDSFDHQFEHTKIQGVDSLEDGEGLEEDTFNSIAHGLGVPTAEGGE